MELKNTRKSYRQALLKVDKAIGDLSRDQTASTAHRDICMRLLCALDIPAMIQRLQMAQLDAPGGPIASLVGCKQLREHQSKIRAVMCLPGCWGYDTALGTALRELYGVEIVL